MINVVHAFTGVDAQYMAEKKVWGKDNINVVGSMEIDVDAIISCALIHENEKFYKHMEKEWSNEDYDNAREWLRKRNIGFDFKTNKSKLDRMKKDKLKQLYVASVCIKNYGDISLANKVKLKDEIDLFTYSFPCTDISVAGKQEGLSKGSGTRSGLLWECEQFIINNKPKVLVMENVKNLVGKKFINEFNSWLGVLDELGYKSYWKVLNAKEYGIPQNRERVFCVSIREDVDLDYMFPQPIKLDKRLKDILESSVDGRYYYNNGRADELMRIIIDKYNKKSIIPCDSTLNQPKELEVANCITARYDAGIQNQRSIGVAVVEPIVAETRCDEGVRLFKDNVCGTIRTVQSGGDKIVVEPKIMKIDIPQQIKVRRYDIDQNDLFMFLKKYKNKSNQQIADELGIAKTTVDHWFRNDQSFSIPSEDIWYDLKRVLNITDDRYDKPITVFDIKDGIYDKNNRCYIVDGIAPTLTTQNGESIIEPQQQRLGGLFDGEKGRHQAGSVWDKDGLAPTLDTMQGGYRQPMITDEFKIRKLTPRECWRLMGFSDEDFDKVKDHVSDSQLYKQAGNSIVVNCLEAIFNNLKGIIG